MPNRLDTDVSEVFAREERKGTAVDMVIAEALDVGLEGRVTGSQPLADLLLAPAIEDGDGCLLRGSPPFGDGGRHSVWS
jgi:hypothetical protein